jgi:glutamine amidotransferase-like uncharacterized protein
MHLLGDVTKNPTLRSTPNPLIVSHLHIFPHMNSALFSATLLLGAWGFVAAGSAATDDLLVPQILGTWTEIADKPDLGDLKSDQQEIVDFGIWQAKGGTWQLWSCVRKTKEPGKTRLFHRWESPSLTPADWKPAGIAMKADASLGETEGGLQAPYVFRDAGKFRMFYGDWVRICSASSDDGKTFYRDPHTDGQPALFAEGAEDNARDPFVIKIGDLWHCYYTATRTLQITENKKPATKKLGVVYVRTSPDLKTWGDRKLVASEGRAGNSLYSAECPHVVDVTPGNYYLFRTQQYGEKAQTCVYHSTDPTDFGWGTTNYGDAMHYVTTLPVAAPELIKQGDKWFIAALRPDLKGIQLARLEWKTVDQIQPRLAPKLPGTVRVALYDDSGSAGKGIPCVSEQLGALHDIDLVRVDSNDIRAGLDGYDAVVFTGGSSGRQANTIGLLGRAQVRRFVERGGGYVGICAGAYLACDGFRWSVKVLDAKTPSSKWMRGIADLKIEANEFGRNVLGYPSEKVTVRYHNGPLLVPAENDGIPDFETLTFFREEVAENGSPAGIMVNSPAMVRSTFGKGRVLVSSPHPEQSAGLESFAEKAIRWVTSKN